MGDAIQKPLISVIVPVYKVEAYLPDCIESIIHQTYHNLEIILVDDGSPDTCPAICDDYAKKDARIKVIHKANGGLSDARNAGLDLCSGYYITFVDSDDLLPFHALEIMMQLAADQNADLVIGEHERFEQNIPVEQSVSENPSVKVLSSEEAMKNMFINGCASWARLYRKSIHDAIRFPAGEINEDEAIVLPLLSKCSRIIQTSFCVYYYRYRSSSITTSSFSPKKLAWYRHCKANYEWIQIHHPELKADAAVRYRNSLLWTLTEIALSNQKYPEAVRQLLAMLHDNQSIFSKIPYQFQTDKIREWLLLYFPFSWYRIFIRLKRKSLRS